MRVLMIAAALAMLGGVPSFAQKIDANGRCHAKDGKFAKMEVCKGAGGPAHAYKKDEKGKCRDEKGKFAAASKCA